MVINSSGVDWKLARTCRLTTETELNNNAALAKLSKNGWMIFYKVWNTSNLKRQDNHDLYLSIYCWLLKAVCVLVFDVISHKKKHVNHKKNSD